MRSEQQERDHQVAVADNMSQAGSYMQDEDRDPPSDHVQRDYILVRFAPGEPANPYNWSIKRKLYIVFAGMLQVINSTLGSALPSGAFNEIRDHFDVSSSQQLTLPISAYLIGYVVGPLLFGPLSETYGRRWVMLPSFLLFIIWTMACALANNFTALCFFRLFTGICASCPIVVIGGLYADIFADPATRGKAMSVFMACTALGPNLSPLISGFVATVGWQWAFWVGLIFAGFSFPFLCCIPETYGPILLRNKARQLRKDHPDRNYVARIELESMKWRDVMTRVIYRPINMILHESIVSFTCLYLSLIYGIFYLYFEAYPIIFQGLYQLSPGQAGIAFLPIFIGSISAYFIFVGYDSYLSRQKKRRKPWAMQEEYQRLPLAIIGGPAFSIGMFWLAWASWIDVHPSVPMLAGIPFGIGFLLIFMALVNYLADAYEIYAASALAATSTVRSIAGAVLPLAADPMYNRLGIHWATSLLGFASAIMILIPMAFIRFGPQLRARSKFSLELKAIRERDELEMQQEERERQRTRSMDTAVEMSVDGETSKRGPLPNMDKDLEAGASDWKVDELEEPDIRQADKFWEAKETL